MISPEYRSTLERMREIEPAWGNGGAKYVGTVLGLLGGRPSILDYGSGLGEFKKACGIRAQVAEYEPSIPEKSELPVGPFEAVVCTHVLEHIEPEHLDATILELAERARRLIFIEVPHHAARAILPDGRNAHLICKTTEWWRDTLIRLLPDWQLETRFPAAPPHRRTQYVLTRTSKC